jgi:hypothetical protein
MRQGKYMVDKVEIARENAVIANDGLSCSQIVAP